jgi:hypothetical protein
MPRFLKTSLGNGKNIQTKVMRRNVEIKISLHDKISSVWFSFQKNVLS